MTKRNRHATAATALGRTAMRAGWLALLLSPLPGAAAAADKVILQLHREPQFEFAGYYAAMWKGFYRDAGLAVEIRPGNPQGRPPIDPVREVIERRAQFGTGTVQVLVHAAEGSPLILLAPIFQQSGAAVYYRADGDFSSARSLLNAKVGRPPPSNILDLELRAMLNSEGIDPDRLKSVSIEPGQAITALAGRRVDAVVGSAWELPWQAQERSVALKSFGLADHRPEFYGEGLFALQRFVNADPTTAQRFREASLKGWEYALRRPDEIAARIVVELPVAVPVSDAAGFARYQSEVARKLAAFPNTLLGQSNPDRWNAIQQSLIAIGAISHPADLEAFLYDPGAAGSGLAYRLSWLIAAAGTVLTLIAAIARAWRNSRRSKPFPAKARRPAPYRNRIAASFDRMGVLVPVRSSLVRLRAMAEETLDRARNSARRILASALGRRPAARPTDINRALIELDGRIRRRLPPNVKCRFSLAPEGWLCHADPIAVTALLGDLVAEAAADMPEGGELVIGTRHCTIDRAKAVEFPGSVAGDYVRATVKDSGRGLPPERLNRIFYPQSTPRAAAAAAWRLTRQLDGFAAAESAEGIGTAVHLYFCRVAGFPKSGNEPIAEDLLKAAE